MKWSSFVISDGKHVGKKTACSPAVRRGEQMEGAREFS